jgi:hypothetical protein
MARRTKKKWKDMSARGRVGVILLAAGQLALKTLAWRDLTKRPADQVRGPKAIWYLGTLVNFFGAVAYLLVGRRRAEKISPTHR